jgi:hypothetical protein
MCDSISELLAIHCVSHKVQKEDMHWTGTLREQGRGVDQEKPGKNDKGNYRRLERAKKSQQD